MCVAYSSDMVQVRDVLLGAARALPWRLEEPSPLVLLLEFGASSVDWEISVWIDDPWRLRSRRSDLQLGIWTTLKEAGVTIAFPQLDLHFDPQVVAGLARNRLSTPSESDLDNMKS